MPAVPTNRSSKDMFDTIIGWVVAAGAAALALWGVRWKIRAGKAQQQIDGYQQSSDRWKEDAARRVEAIKRQSAGKAPIDPKDRSEFESGND